MKTVAELYREVSSAFDLTKRDVFAMAAMQGVIATDSCDPAQAARYAVDFADALLAELEKQA